MKEGKFNQLKCANVLNEVLVERQRQEQKWGTEMDKRELQSGDVVQLSDECGNPHFRGAFMMVTEPKGFGAQGFVHGLERGQAYYRAKWEEMEYIGKAAFILEDEDETPDLNVTAEDWR